MKERNGGTVDTAKGSSKGGGTGIFRAAKGGGIGQTAGKGIRKGLTYADANRFRRNY